VCSTLLDALNEVKDADAKDQLSKQTWKSNTEGRARTVADDIADVGRGLPEIKLGTRAPRQFGEEV
jgi:hypothetical protein